MNRTVISFACEGETLFGTLDMGLASGAVGLLLVSGGNEIRSGAWGGQAALAAALAREGIPVFRFDRRGVGDSSGANLGFRASAPDIAAALAAFRSAAPHVKRVFALGNCDAASALMLHAALLPGLDGLILANPGPSMLKMKRRRSIPPRRCAGTICGGWSIPGNGRGCLAVRWRWVGSRRGCALPLRRKELRLWRKRCAPGWRRSPARSRSCWPRRPHGATVSRPLGQ
jgi:pimeloyl-ACP methyl ester carboxylesterase